MSPRRFVDSFLLTMLWVLIVVLPPVASLAQPGGSYEFYQPLGPRAGSRKGPETDKIRIAQQFGIGYLPLIVMRQYQLIEQQIRRANLGDVQVIWTRYPSGKVMNDALSSGLLDFAAGGVVPLLRAWDNSGGSTRGVAALSAMPLYLVANNLSIKSLRDFSDRDRIALPRVGTSSQALLLQMAAAKVFGLENYQRLDGITVSMSHPDGLGALMAGRNGITAQFSSPPFQYQAVQAGIPKVLDSYEILGGPATFTALWSRSDFRDANPRTFRAVYDALRQAMFFIAENPYQAAEAYLQQSGTLEDIGFIEQMIARPEIEFTYVPNNIKAYAVFMHSIGELNTLPRDWQAIFFDDVLLDVGR